MTAAELEKRLEDALKGLEAAGKALGSAKIAVKEILAEKQRITARLEATDELARAVSDAIHHIEPDAMVERSEGREREGRACKAQNAWGKALQKARNLK